MEVKAVDMDEVSRVLERAFNVAVLPHAVPHSVRTGFFVEDAVVCEGLLGFDHRFERLVLDLDEFSSIVGKTRGFRGHSGNRRALVKGFAPRHWEGAKCSAIVR